MFGRCPSSPFRSWSGSLTARPAAPSVECLRPPRSARGLFSASSSPRLCDSTSPDVAYHAVTAVLAEERADTRRPWLAPALSAAAIAALAIYGAVRLERTPTSYVKDVRLRIMQPNLQQDEKFNYSQKQQVMSRYLALSDRPSGPQSPGLRRGTLLIWPESAFPFFLTLEPGC